MECLNRDPPKTGGTASTRPSGRYPPLGPPTQEAKLRSPSSPRRLEETPLNASQMPLEASKTPQEAFKTPQEAPRHTQDIQNPSIWVYMAAWQSVHDAHDPVAGPMGTEGPPKSTDFRNEKWIFSGPTSQDAPRIPRRPQDGPTMRGIRPQDAPRTP